MTNNKSYKNKKTNNKNKPRQSVNSEVIRGKIDANSKGFGFLVCENREEDIFIAASKMNGAMHGDIADVLLISGKRGGGEGEVVKVIERANKVIVGTYIKNKSFGFVIPDNSRILTDIYVKNTKNFDIENNQKVVVEITDYSKKNIEGKILEVLGYEGEKGVDVLSIIRAHNLYEEFPKSVLKEASQKPKEVLIEERAGRVDFTGDLIITIDGDDSRDFDDAVSLVKLSEGLYRLSVHIADVAHYVQMGSKLDKEAFKRGTSVYFPDLVLHMLPEDLSCGICSLKENTDRLTLSLVMDIDNSGKVINKKICEGIIRSKRRMTYSKVSKIFDGDAQLTEEYKDIAPMLCDMKSLAMILFEKRKARGTVEFELTETEFIMDGNGKIADIRKKPRLISHRIIEEFMLIANETIAEHMFRIESPFVYRSHEAPSSEKVENLIDFLSALGINFTGDSKAPLSMDFAKLLSGLPSDIAPTISRVTLRSMMKASYEPINNGHFGLAAEYYCHFTSPIRRYPDLAIHRIIKDYLKNGKKSLDKYKEFTIEAAKQSSERERLAEKAEREVDDFKKAEFMIDKIGQCFDGIISGVTEWGIFAELDNSVEGLIKTENLPGNNYEFNPKLWLLSNGANIYRIGDKIRIKVEAVTADRVEFVLSDEKIK